MSIKKLDGKLRRLARSQEEELGRTRSARAKPAAAMVDMLVEFTGSIEELQSVGFRPRSVIPNRLEGYTIATGEIPIDRLEALAAIPHVILAEGPRPMTPELDQSLPAIGANAVHSSHPDYKGRGTIVGVIDSGIEWRHGSFWRVVDGRKESRILALWDQTLTPQGSETAAPQGGVVYTRTQLSAALNGQPGTVRTRDLEKDGHGTHVAGIAAGSGAPATCCRGGGTYVGVAPEADLIVVNNRGAFPIGTSPTLVDALQWIFTQAGSIPTVVNISLGDNTGPHDGTNLVERAIDKLVTEQAGRAVVKSAGNEGCTKKHAQGVLNGGASVDLNFELPGGVAFSRCTDLTVDLWYTRDRQLEVEVLFRGTGAPTSVVTAGHGVDPAPGSHDVYKVSVDSTINGAHGRDNRFEITIDKPAGSPWGRWTLRLRNPAPDPIDVVRYHCWIEHGTGLPTFGDQANPASTLSIPGTARQVISVASHGLGNRLDTISNFSSRGPVARDELSNPKPNLAAPGEAINAPQRNVDNMVGNCCAGCDDGCCCLYHALDGTSMSAPHVTGVIALMLEKNPTLTRDQILSALSAGITTVSGSNPNIWGAGRLNARGAVDAVTELGTARSMHERRSALTPEVSPAVPSVELPALEDAIRIIRARASAIPNGDLFAALISRHFSEGRRLVNTHRRIATMWHRAEGPRMMVRCFAGAVDSEADAPLSSRFETQRLYFERFLDMLAEYGSQKLRNTISEHRAFVTQILSAPLAAQLTPQGRV